VEEEMRRWPALKGGGGWSSSGRCFERRGEKGLGAASSEDGREGHHPLYMVGAGERRWSGTETASDGGVFKAFNVVSFVKRNGGDDAGY
jgi:hypothetical protein